MTNDILLTRHNQEIAQWSPDPFPRERVGSGHETIVVCTSLGLPEGVWPHSGKGVTCVASTDLSLLHCCFPVTEQHSLRCDQQREGTDASASLQR